MPIALKSALLSVLLLTGCARTQPVPVTKTETVILSPPPELAVCADAPALPPEPLTDQGVGEYILRLHGAHQDCARALERLVQWGKEARARVEAKK